MDWFRNILGLTNSANDKPAAIENKSEGVAISEVQEVPETSINVQKSEPVKMPGIFSIFKSNSNSDNIGSSPPETGFIMVEAAPVKSYKARVDLFNYLSDHDTDYIESELDEYLTDSWNESAIDTAKILMEVGCLYAADWAIKNNHIESIDKNFNFILENTPDDIKFKFLLKLLGTPLEKKAISAYATCLKKDVECLKWDDFDNISLAGRYAPSQQGSLDKAHNAVSKLVAEMGISKRTYRREYLLPLRNFIREHRVEEKVEEKMEKYFRVSADHPEPKQCTYDDIRKLIDHEKYFGIQL